MRPDRLTVALRPRSAMEAVDLGFAMAQTHGREIRRAWLRIVLPVMIALALVEQLLPEGYGITGMLLWWAKPFYDIVVLLVLSRAVFGEQLKTRDLLGELRRAAGSIAAALTWRRFSLSRSFLLPAHLLEGLRGRASRARVNLLQDATSGSARLATIGCGWAELAALAGIASLAVWFTPELYREGLLRAFTAGSGHLEMACWQFVYALAISIVEPFYVAAGFALYLNRRTQLEGWDIEVALRRFDARLPAPAAEIDADAVEPSP